MRRAGKDLIGEKPGFAGEASRGFKLASDVGAYFLYRIAVGAHLAKGRQPYIQQVGEKRHVNVFLVPEVVQQVRLRHVGLAGNPVERRAVEAVFGKDVEGGLQDPCSVFLLDAGAATHRPFAGPRLRVC